MNVLHTHSLYQHLIVAVILLLPNTSSSQSFCDDFGNNGFTESVFSHNTRYNKILTDGDGVLYALGTLFDGKSSRLLITQLDETGTRSTTFGKNGNVLSLASKDSRFLYSGAIYDELRVFLGSDEGRIYKAFGSISYLLSIPVLGRVTGMVKKDNILYAAANGFEKNVDVIAFNEDGSLDESFGDNGLVRISYPDVIYPQKPTLLAVAPDGKLVIAFSIEKPDGLDFLATYRINADGTLDASWGNSIVGLDEDVFDYVCNALIIGENGEVITIGTKHYFDKDNEVIAHRFLPNGALDQNFDVDGIAIYDSPINVRSAELDNNGNILLVGSIGENTDEQFVVTGFSNTGSKLPLTIFLPDAPQVASGILNDIAADQQEGGWWVAGTVTLTDFSTRGIVMRLNPNTAVDDQFSDNGLFMENLADIAIIETIVKRPDGKILAAGRFEKVKSDFQQAIGQFLSTGEPDPNFGYYGGTIGSNGNNYHDLAVLGNGQVYAIGPAPSAGGTVISRYNDDGTLDNNFKGNGRTNLRGACSNCAETSKAAIKDGQDRLIIVGNAERLPGTGNQRNGVILRMDTDGNKDNDFGDQGSVVLDYGLQESLEAVAVNGNDEVIAAGWYSVFVNSNLEYVHSVVKLDANGTVDASFGDQGLVTITQPGAFDTKIAGIEVLDNDNILIAGSYKLQGSPSHITRGFMLMLNANGQPSASFGENGYLEILADDGDLNTLNGMTLSDDNRILVIGNTRGDSFGFVSIYGLTGERQVYRALDDGNFFPTAVLSYEDNIILSGRVDGRFGFFIACLNTNLNITSIESFSDTDKIIYPNPAQNKLNISNLQREKATYQIIDFSGKKWDTGFLSRENMVIDISDLPGGMYLLKVSDQALSRGFTFIKK